MKRHERVYYHYEELEEYHAGMWRIVRGEARKQFIVLSAELMRNAEEFCKAMQRATLEWPKSAAHNLTIEAANRLAWLGHAGCCVNHGASEEATRAAWHTLLKNEQAIANDVAATVLYRWDSARIENDLFAWAQNAEKPNRY